ncbi:hypothetical protein B0H13DRAFT_1902282 [Mycena leptocephala]|nr:hypothetical protein B0H13DRAFT_1902282 [Mycena leptocephala]
MASAKNQRRRQALHHITDKLTLGSSRCQESTAEYGLKLLQVVKTKAFSRGLRSQWQLSKSFSVPSSLKSSHSKASSIQALKSPQLQTSCLQASSLQARTRTISTARMMGGGEVSEDIQRVHGEWNDCAAFWMRGCGWQRPSGSHMASLRQWVFEGCGIEETPESSAVVGAVRFHIYRMGVATYVDYCNDWEMGARGGEDIWVHAEQFITRKRCGEVEGQFKRYVLSIDSRATAVGDYFLNGSTAVEADD